MRGGWGASLDGAGRADLGEKSGRDSLASHFLTQLGLAEADPEREAGTSLPCACTARRPACENGGGRACRPQMGLAPWSSPSSARGAPGPQHWARRPVGPIT